MHDSESFSDFFHTATGNQPYSWQTRLASGELEYPVAEDVSCASLLIDIPTGLGKTAGVVLAWIWNRVILQRRDWPRRLIYCLPMRTLVEQTSGSVDEWLGALIKKYPKNEELQWLKNHSPIILMGGEEHDEARRDWDLYPERAAILIGTQDMLLSRALNRGYGMSRYRWPMHFGLLNNDCLWIMDETQLMGVGIETSAQLAGLREKLKTQFAAQTWWMSATLDRERFNTVDFIDTVAKSLATHQLSEIDRSAPPVCERIKATKSLEKAPIAPYEKAANLKKYAQVVADFALDKHRAGTLTLIIVNRVNRAQEIRKALAKLNPGFQVGLIHSRFRPLDRAKQEPILKAEGDRIVVATQAVEAGVDVSAATLITELAPWPSLVQRFGRCNRDGRCQDGGQIFWINLQPKDEKDDRVLPYTLGELRTATSLLSNHTCASPESLSKIDYEPPPVIRPVLRRKDLIDLFDTTPDLSGNDIDISRYVRDSTEVADVQVFWRKIDPADKEKTDKEWSRPDRRELCRVSITDIRKFAKKKLSIFLWNGLSEQWEPLSQQAIAPGSIYILPYSDGGYSASLGWTGNTKDLLTAVDIPEVNSSMPDALNRDPGCFLGEWVSLKQHQWDVETYMAKILDNLAMDSDLNETLITAARWHDVGKAHEVFQDMLKTGGPPPDPDKKLHWAKSEKSGRIKDKKRRGFRHELASALAWLQNASDNQPDTNLIAFLIAAHHGKIRLSIRSMPNEVGPEDETNTDRLFARGVWDGDDLQEVELSNGETAASCVLDLSCMQLGKSDSGPSWLARMTHLRDSKGPFRLTHLETLLRAADARGSKYPNTR